MSTAPGIVFGDFSEEYDRYRPDYPSALWEKLGLGKGDRVVDLGAGTGRASFALALCGCVVTAVEPDSQMANVIRASSARGGAKIGVIEATAERTGLGAESQNAVVAAQAYHWFEVPDSNREAFRVLRPGGIFAVFANNRKVEGSAWLEAFEELIIHFNPAHSRDYRQFDVEERLGRGIRPSAIESAVFPHSFEVDIDGFVGLARTISYVRKAINPADLVRFEGELRKLLVEAHGDQPFSVPFETKLTVAKKES